MILIIGLGNPGWRYQHTPHNVGFNIIDELQKRELPENVILFKPSSFMNLSGNPVRQKVKETNPTDIWVIHDDVDLPRGQIRICRNRGAAGHKGVLSIMSHLKTKDFGRVRVGVGRSGELKSFVLSSSPMPEIIKRGADAVEAILKLGTEKAKTEYNKKID
jgi:peptidyl-tRNA hydrolase, PTH1 family